MDETKKCPRCNETKPRTEFGKVGKAPYCRPCRAEYAREYQCKPERRAYKKQWEDDNRDHVRAQQAVRREGNREYYREASRKSMRKLSALLRQQVLDRYGRACACCGEAIEVFLVIDHIEGGGNTERNEHTNGLAGWVFYRWLSKQGWPDGYQTLCHNCNYAKHRLGQCPHHAKE